MKRYKTTVTCYYCPATFERPQGRASHIRKSHPGMPYRPTPEQIAKYAAPPEEAIALPVAVLELPPPADIAAMSPRQHLVAAISELKHQLQTACRQIPDLETQLQGLRGSQSRIEQELKALETALTTIDGSGQERAEIAASASGSRA